MISSSPVKPVNRRGSRGQALVEFSIVGLMVCILLLAALEVSRLVLAYTTVANAAREGARYATAHGSSRTGAGVDGPSGPGANPTQVLTVVTDFAGTGSLKSANLQISVAYPGGSNAPGQVVTVTAVYVYDPLTTYFPFSVRLGSTTQGVIVY
jgi:Flp pilus assembly protein TadG